jgi:tetratricopeptide (TPR) repeat protein
LPVSFDCSVRSIRRFTGGSKSRSACARNFYRLLSDEQKACLNQLGRRKVSRLAKVIKLIAIAGNFLGLTIGLASAGVLDDCRQDWRQPDLRLQACTAVIEDTSFGVAAKVLALNSRGEMRVEAGAPNQAITDFTESIRLQSNNRAAFAGRGQARFASGDYRGAIDDYSQAIRISPEATDYIERGHAYLASGNADASIRDLTEAIRLDPASASARNNRGLAYRKKGDAEQALRDYNAAISLNPVYALAYANRGFLFESQGQKKRAIESLLQAIMLDPSQTAVSDALKRLGLYDIVQKGSDRRVRRGKALAETNCSGCHAIGEGLSPNRSAPAFRELQRRYRMLALRKPITRAIAAPHDQMPRFVLSDDDVDMIVAYINHLAVGP